jgi:hypothetical protein
VQKALYRDNLITSDSFSIGSKLGYNYTRSHLAEWFPKLPSYVAFIQRLNRLENLFPALAEHILSVFPIKILYGISV